MAKANQESQLLDLLKSVLPKAVSDPKLADKIYSALEKALSAGGRGVAFDKFCKRTSLPDLEEETLEEVKKDFEASFGKGTVSLVPHPAKKAVSVEVVTKDGTFEGVIKIGTVNNEEGGGDEPKPKFVAFPICLATDPELIWVLARDERMTPEEASIALAKSQDSFWESKAGQQHLQKRVERTFPEFIAKVPSKALTEVGLKRHYKDPEPLKQIKLLKARKHD
jgi:hypothetical protein